MNEIPKGVSPGQNTVVIAGEKYTLIDDNGDETGIEAREHPDVLAFLRSFDEWLTIDAIMGQSDAVDAAWAVVREKWSHLPVHVRKDLPSARRGIYIPGRSSDA